MADETLKEGAQVAVIKLKDGTTLTFVVERDHYSDFLDDSTDPSGGKLAAMHNLLMRSADADTKESLAVMLKKPANTTLLAGAVLEQCKPDVELAVKL